MVAEMWHSKEHFWSLSHARLKLINFSILKEVILRKLKLRFCMSIYMKTTEKTLNYQLFQEI